MGGPGSGGQTKLTPELTVRFCKLVSDGAWMQVAAAECGVGVAVVDRWLRAAEEDGASALVRDFADRVARARAEAEAALLEGIRAVGTGESEKGDWKALAWILEKKNPKVYRETKRQEITGAEGGPVEMADAGARVAARLAAMRAKK